MHIFIDESGSLSGFHEGSISAVPPLFQSLKLLPHRSCGSSANERSYFKPATTTTCGHEIVLARCVERSETHRNVFRTTCYDGLFRITRSRYSHKMRPKILLIFAFLLAALPAAARDATIKDGRFTICAFQNFEKCRLLTTSTIRRYRLAAEEKRVLKELKQYTAAQNVTLADLEKSFGKPSKVIPHASPDDKTVAWFKDSVGLNDLNAKCPECGIYVRLL